MCGRYSLRRADYTRAEFAALKQLSFEEFDERPVPRFNIAPSQRVPAVRLNSQNDRILSSLSWGLVPSWAKPDTKVKPINARAEAICTSGMFRQAFERRRCLIPADGFYEWQGAKPPKQPYFIHRPDDGIFAFAGLWERWKPADDAPPLDTCTIITTEPNAVMRAIHNRMPVILDREDYTRWLDREIPGKDVFDLLRPYDGELQAHPVSTRVNKPANDGPDLIEPDDGKQTDR
jgi:putative SOS response-associated peptidase YedK